MGKSILPVSLSFLREILQLPEDVTILTVVPNLEQKYLALLLESDALPEVEESQPYPQASAIYTVEHYPEDPEFRKLSVRVEVAIPPVQPPSSDLLSLL